MVEKDSPFDANEQPPQRPRKVIGPDGKPCRVCAEFRSWNPTASKIAARSTGKGELATSISKKSAAAVPLVPQAQRLECPPDGGQLGRATWTFLHTTAAYYPERPTAHQRANMLGLLRALPVLYPCESCASHLGEMMKEHPPDVSNGKVLSRWLCERHNEVNEMLGKESFDCDLTDKRWKEGPSDGSCD